MPLGRCEKNWAFFSLQGDLYFIYLFRPYRLLKMVCNWKFETLLWSEWSFLSQHEGLAQERFISMSTNPIDYDEERFLCFIHTVNGDGNYEHYGVTINKRTLLPMSISRKPAFVGGKAWGQYSHVLYLTSVVKMDDLLLLFLGEADEHVSCVAAPVQEVDRFLENSIDLKHSSVRGSETIP